MSLHQHRQFTQWVYDHLFEIESFHHGDCIGSDHEAHEIVKDLIPVVVHPPLGATMRAFCEDGRRVITRQPSNYLTRNRDMVNECDVLVATPLTDMSSTGGRIGGTWYTIRYAQKVGKEVFIIWR